MFAASHSDLQPFLKQLQSSPFSAAYVLVQHALVYFCMTTLAEQHQKLWNHLSFQRKKKSETVYIHKWYLFKQFLQLLLPLVAS